MVRQRSAKPSFPGSNPGGTSITDNVAENAAFLFFIFSLLSPALLFFRLFVRFFRMSRKKIFLREAAATGISCQRSWLMRRPGCEAAVISSENQRFEVQPENCRLAMGTPHPVRTEHLPLRWEGKAASPFLFFEMGRPWIRLNPGLTK